jgi:hypothetical protein
MDPDFVTDGERHHDRFIPPGTQVRYDGAGRPEYGVVVHCWANAEIGGRYDCYVAFFGAGIPAGEPEETPYILRYAAISLSPIAA